MGWVIGGVAAVMGLFAGASASGQWRSFSLWRHSQDFGTTDPYFNKDVGFYVFDLPFWHYVVDYVMALAVVGLIAALMVNYLFGGIRLSGRPGERITSAAQIQGLGAAGAVRARQGVDTGSTASTWSPVGLDLHGMGYTDDKAVLPAKEILAGIAIVCALLFLANSGAAPGSCPRSASSGCSRCRRSSWASSSPPLVQAIRVNPNVPDREGVHLRRTFDATRAAYGLDQIEVRDISGTGAPEDGRLEAPVGITSSIPLVVPADRQRDLRAAAAGPGLLLGRQRPRRRPLRDRRPGPRRRARCPRARPERPGRERPELVQLHYRLHPRQRRHRGLRQPASRGRPAQQSSVQWAEGQEPGEDRPDPPGRRGRLRDPRYFGEQSPSYSIVGLDPETKQAREFDLPRGERTDEDVATTYDGKAGVPIGSLFNQLLYAVRYGEPNCCCRAACTTTPRSSTTATRARWWRRSRPG